MFTGFVAAVEVCVLCDCGVRLVELPDVVVLPVLVCVCCLFETVLEVVLPVCV